MAPYGSGSVDVVPSREELLLATLGYTEIQSVFAVYARRLGKAVVGWIKYNREIIYGDERYIQPPVLRSYIVFRSCYLDFRLHLDGSSLFATYRVTCHDLGTT